MKHEVKKTLRVNVPADKIWEVLGDFSSVERYAPTIKSSPIVRDISSGLGAKRLNTFYDGTSLIEEISNYQEGQGYKMKLSEYSFPLKYMNSEVGVKAIDSKSCKISMNRFDFLSVKRQAELPGVQLENLTSTFFLPGYFILPPISAFELGLAWFWREPSVEHL